MTWNEALKVWAMGMVGCIIIIWLLLILTAFSLLILIGLSHLLNSDPIKWLVFIMAVISIPYLIGGLVIKLIK